MYNALTVNYAACNADLTKVMNDAFRISSCDADCVCVCVRQACMWTSIYYAGPAETLALTTRCTNGGPDGLPTITTGENGAVISGQRQPNVTSNSWAASPRSAAPFDLGTCYTAAGPVNGVYRSMRVYCDASTVPATYAGLPVFDTRSTVPSATTAPASTTTLQFDPVIASSCVTVQNGVTDPNQAYLVYWAGQDVRHASCSGNPSFIAVGGSTNCLQVEYQGTSRGYVDLMSLYCNVNG